MMQPPESICRDLQNRRGISNSFPADIYYNQKSIIDLEIVRVYRLKKIVKSLRYYLIRTPQNEFNFTSMLMLYMILTAYSHWSRQL